MPTAAGLSIAANAQFGRHGWRAIIFRRPFPCGMILMVRAAYLTTSLMVSAWHLLRDAHGLNSVPHDEQPSVAVLFYSFCVTAGAAILMPIIRAYTAHTYWVFRGRMNLSQGRH